MKKLISLLFLLSISTNSIANQTNPYLTSPLKSSGDLISRLENPSIEKRYEITFQKSKSKLVELFSKLKPQKLSKDYTLRIFYWKNNLPSLKERKLKKGTKVLALGNYPIIQMECGNPIKFIQAKEFEFSKANINKVEYPYTLSNTSMNKTVDFVNFKSSFIGYPELYSNVSIYSEDKFFVNNSESKSVDHIFENSKSYVNMGLGIYALNSMKHRRSNVPEPSVLMFLICVVPFVRKRND